MKNNRDNLLVIGVFIVILAEAAFSIAILLAATSNLTPSSSPSDFVRLDKEKYETVKQEKLQR